MPFNISEFKSVMNRHGGAARSSLFEVIISPANERGEFLVPGVISTSDLRFFCQSVSVPGINLETSTYRPSGFGFPEFIPVSSSPDQLNAIFLLDSNHRVLTFFHRWISSVINVSGNRGDSVRGLSPNLIEYKDNYTASELTIRHYSTHDPFRFYEFKYSKVYPTQVSSIDMNWTARDEPATITVNFSYSRLIYQGFNDISFERSRSFTGTNFSLPRNASQQQFISDFSQRQVDELTVLSVE